MFVGITPGVYVTKRGGGFRIMSVVFRRSLNARFLFLIPNRNDSYPLTAHVCFRGTRYQWPELITAVLPYRLIALKMNEDYGLNLTGKAVTDKVAKVKNEYLRTMQKGGVLPEPSYYSILHANIGTTTMNNNTSKLETGPTSSSTSSRAVKRPARADKHVWVLNYSQMVFYALLLFAHIEQTERHQAEMRKLTEEGNTLMREYTEILKRGT
eukprot:sb/3470177/